MAVIREMAEPAFSNWLASRPAEVRALIEKYQPNRLYLLKTSGHRVTIHSYSEGGTLTVNVTGEYNLITFPRCVFGIKPEDLEECDLPAEGEALGSMLETKEEIDAHLEELRRLLGHA